MTYEVSYISRLARPAVGPLMMMCETADVTGHMRAARRMRCHTPRSGHRLGHLAAARRSVGGRALPALPPPPRTLCGVVAVGRDSRV